MLKDRKKILSLEPDPFAVSSCYVANTLQKP